MAMVKGHYGTEAAIREWVRTLEQQARWGWSFCHKGRAVSDKRVDLPDGVTVSIGGKGPAGQWVKVFVHGVQCGETYRMYSQKPGELYALVGAAIDAA